MAQYMCKVLDRRGGVTRIVPYVADSDRHAIDQGILLQLISRGATGFEVWQSARLVMAFQAGHPAWRSRRRRMMQTQTAQRTLQPT